MWAYAGYQVGDLLRVRLLPLLAVTALGTWGLVVANGVTRATLDPASGIAGRDRLQHTFAASIALFAATAAVLSAQGLAARDRRRGWDAIWFSRPLRPVRFYLQGFVLSGLVGVLVGVLAAELYAMTVYPVFVPGVAALVAIVWWSVGGFAFFVSLLTRFHTVIVAALALVTTAPLLLSRAHLLDAAPPLAPLARAASMPARVLLQLAADLSRGEMPSRPLVAWTLLFGVACVTGALTLLRRRPFGS